MAPLSSPAAECVRLTGPGAEDPAVAAAVGNYLERLACDGVRVRIPDVPADSALGRMLFLSQPWPPQSPTTTQLNHEHHPLNTSNMRGPDLNPMLLLVVLELLPDSEVAENKNNLNFVVFLKISDI